MIHNNKIKIYTLAMKELHERHTADNLKSEIENILKEFDLKANQIYTITTDNGRNMVKAVEIFSSENLIEPEEDEQFLETNSHKQNAETFTENFCCEQSTISVKCAAHTLQLAIKDFFSKNKIAVLDRAREIVKTLRTPTFRYSLEHLCLKKPRMDVLTRENSTFDMLNRLLEHTQFCNNNLKHPVALSKEEWVTIEELVKVLTPLNEATLKLQKSQLFFGDFYKLWLNLKLKLKTMTSNTARMILYHIEVRESQLLKNDAINAAIFLDPRLKRLLTADQKAKVKKHLKIIAAQMLSLKQSNKTIGKIAEAACKENYAIPSTSNTSVSLLQKTINEMEVDSSFDDDTEAINSIELSKIYAEIDSYKEKHVDIKIEIMAYWQDKKYVMPYITKLATICLLLKSVLKEPSRL